MQAHFAPHIIFVIKQLVRASRKQRLQLVPVVDAVAMALLVAPVTASLGPSAQDTKTPNSGAAAAGRMERPRTAWDNIGASHVAARRAADFSDSAPPRGVVVPTGATAALFTHLVSNTAQGQMVPTMPEVRTYGQLFEALVRGWHMLPVGVYRRMEPGSLPQPPVVTDPLSQFVAAFAPHNIVGHEAASGLNTSTASASSSSGGAGWSGVGGGNYTGSAIFRNEKGLLSYVFSNPPPDTLLNKHDMVYVLRPGGMDEEDE